MNIKLRRDLANALEMNYEVEFKENQIIITYPSETEPTVYKDIDGNKYKNFIQTFFKIQ